VSPTPRDSQRSRGTWFYGDHTTSVWQGSPVRPVTFIVTTLEKRGAGKDGDPVRKVAQFWTEDGAFVMEFDPCSETPMLWSQSYFGKTLTDEVD
jgi:hypothetical protein